MTAEVPDTTAAFWSALADDRFLIGHCSSCDEAYFPPGPACPFCAGDGDRVEASGRGTVYSFTRLHRTAPGFEEPLVMGLVELDEGPRVLTPMAIAYDDLEIGASVRLVAVEYEGPMDRGRLEEAPFYTAVR